MAFCPNCGSEAQGAFCPACGAQVSGGAAQSQSSSQQASQQAPQQPLQQASQLDDHLVNALCYLLWPLTGILFLVLEPYKTNRAIRFHAFQSIFVFAALFAISMSLSILAFTPYIGLLFSLVTLAFPFAAFAVWLFLIIKAYTKERFVVPVLGPLAESQT